MADVLLRGIGEVVNAAGGGKGGHGADAHGVHDALHRDLAHLHSGLLHGAGPAVADDLLEQLAVKHQPPPPQAEDGHFVFDVDGAEQAAHCLAQHRGEGAALRAPGQHFDKEQVTADVQHRADHQEIQGALAVTQCPHDGGQKIIKECKDQAGKYNAEIPHGHGQDVCRHLQ